MHSLDSNESPTAQYHPQVITHHSDRACSPQKLFHLKRPSDGQLPNCPRYSQLLVRDHASSCQSIPQQDSAADLRRRSSLPDNLNKRLDFDQFDFGLPDVSTKRHSSGLLCLHTAHGLEATAIPPAEPSQSCESSPSPSRRPSYSLFPPITAAVNESPVEKSFSSVPPSPSVGSGWTSRNASISTASCRSRADSAASVKLPSTKKSSNPRRRGFLPTRPMSARLRSTSGSSISQSPIPSLPSVSPTVPRDVSRWSDETFGTIVNDSPWPRSRTGAFSGASVTSAQTAIKRVASRDAWPSPPRQPSLRTRYTPLTCLSMVSTTNTTVPSTPATSWPTSFLSETSSRNLTSFFDSDDSDNEQDIPRRKHSSSSSTSSGVDGGQDNSDGVSLLKKWTGGKKRRPSAPRILTIEAKIDVPAVLAEKGHFPQQPTLSKSPTASQSQPHDGESPSAIDWAPVGGGRVKDGRSSPRMLARAATPAILNNDQRVLDVEDGLDDDENTNKGFWQSIFCVR